MKEIVILSGKGGVGKSSITASLAVLAARTSRVLLSDTDVDAPNLDLVFGARPIASEEITTSSKAFVAPDRCSGCMYCKTVCRFAAIIGDDQPIIVPYSCEGCGACTIVCPEGAITIKAVINGRIKTFEAADMHLVAGELYIGASSSGRIVDLVKKRARQKAEKDQVDILLIDGPPGIGCPVIASVKGADYVVAVTEPTPAALSDLQRVIDVISSFRIPLGIVLNRADVHAESNQAIKRFAQKKRFSILAEIPYDISVPMALAKARPVVSAYPAAPSSRALAGLWDTLLTNQ